jgi:hypothetical protein
MYMRTSYTCDRELDVSIATITTIFSLKAQIVVCEDLEYTAGRVTGENVLHCGGR